MTYRRHLVSMRRRRRLFMVSAVRSSGQGTLAGAASYLLQATTCRQRVEAWPGAPRRDSAKFRNRGIMGEGRGWFVHIAPSELSGD